MKKIDIEKTVRTLIAACDERSELHEIYKKRVVQIILMCLGDLSKHLIDNDYDDSVNMEDFVSQWVEVHCKMQE